MLEHSCVLSVIFFFQAEDGIRDIGVTGVQTCALPILSRTGPLTTAPVRSRPAEPARSQGRSLALLADARRPRSRQIGRAAGRGRVEISVVAVSLKKKKTHKSYKTSYVYSD